MRPVIDENGARLVDDDGSEIPGVCAFTVRYEMGDVLRITDAHIIATAPDGKKITGRSSRDYDEKKK